MTRLAGARAATSRSADHTSRCLLAPDHVTLPTLTHIKGRSQHVTMDAFLSLRGQGQGRHAR